MPNLYIIAGCNGAGKTTASYTVLPELLNIVGDNKGGFKAVPAKELLKKLPQ